MPKLPFQNHSNIKLPDHEGRTALTYARAAASLATAQQQQQQLNQQQQSQTNNCSGSSSSGPHYSVESTSALVDVLTALGCPDAPLQSSNAQQQQQHQHQHSNNSLMGGTLPRRRETLGATAFDKMQPPPPSTALDKSKQSSVT